MADALPLPAPPANPRRRSRAEFEGDDNVLAVRLIQGTLQCPICWQVCDGPLAQCAQACAAVYCEACMKKVNVKEGDDAPACPVCRRVKLLNKLFLKVRDFF